MNRLVDSILTRASQAYLVRADVLRINASFIQRSVSTTTPAPPAPGNPFHLAIPVHSMRESKAFYGNILGLPTGRDSGPDSENPDKWQDYSLFGHQIVCHYVGDKYRAIDYYNPVDGDEVPVPHFGVVLQSLDDFHSIAKKLKDGGVNFIIAPTLRFKGTPGEQWTCFVKDPSGNNLEFKYVTNPAFLFAKFTKNNK